MPLLPLNRLGAREIAPHRVEFGLYLPWVSAANGNELFLKIIHEQDQFLQRIPPKYFSLRHSQDSQYNNMDYWSCIMDINEAGRTTPDSVWGTKGTYVYRYELRSPLLKEPLDWIIDPFAREFGVGRLSAITLGFEPHVWDDSVEKTWKTPRLRDLVVYELMLEEFAPGLAAAEAKLPYLRDLGVNCIEIMPVTNVERPIDWGFEPIGFFGMDERFGNRKDFQCFIEAAHRNGIAVVLDMIYGHTSEQFAYNYVFSKLNYAHNPFIGAFGDMDSFGASVNYRLPFVRDFYQTVNRHWLECYHVDGIRYDCVPNYYDGPVGDGFSNLAYTTYCDILQEGDSGYCHRFHNNGSFNLIQCAEQLQKPLEVASSTYANCTWQNETLGAARGVASDPFNGVFSRLFDYGLRLGLEGFPAITQHNMHRIEKTAFQYLENHDHSRLICHYGVVNLKGGLWEGNRDHWYKLQPHLIGLLLSKGIPLLWQGQELVENYAIPDEGIGRIGLLRPVRWEYFYDAAGQGMIRLVRKLLALRKAEDVFRQGDYDFYNDWGRYQSKGLLPFRRMLGDACALVVLNFSNEEAKDVSFALPRAGAYTERLQGGSIQVTPNQGLQLTIPSNYGQVWVHRP